MKHDDLLRTLAGIRAELEGVEFRDPGTRHRLEQLLEGIEQQAGTGRDREQVGPLVSNLSDTVRQMEVEHPALTAGLGQLVSMLSTMGI
jgi:hypothetical protein